MYGIVGYIGKGKALPILVNGLKRMEYRGYDSAGVALVDDGKMKVVKRPGAGHNSNYFVPQPLCGPGPHLFSLIRPGVVLQSQGRTNLR
jgi:glucosamine--fructose-6-phosphate aminotransferase (isomerizing)